ncbi:MAG TPA: DUF63 family protein [Candidatus Thermoplasmatota archaeon]|nr:DUF63 family protein [Candidatus Thermoplasmatota archaeon]
MPERDDRPFYALAALGALLAIALLVPTSRAWLLDAVVGPLRAQADPAPGLANGYTFPSLLVWAIVGGVFAWAAYEVVFVRAAFVPDRAFFLALAPALLLGPLLHAALVARVLPRGSLLAYMGAEPLVYVTIALFAAAGLALGRVTRRPVLVPLVWGMVGVALVLALLLPRVDAEGLKLAGVLLALALGSALGMALIYARLRTGDPFAAIFAVVAAHALDGATTWMVLRDPFGLGFRGFGERNPVSLTLVNLGNGWPYFALKLALPLVLLLMVKRDETEERLRAFLLFAVFVLGFGPGMANLLQVMTG